MPLQAEHPASSGGQMIGGGTSHTAQSHHDDVVTRCCADHVELPPDRGHLRIDDRLSVLGAGAGTVVLKYGVPGSCNACPDMTFTIVQFLWRGDHVEMQGNPPNTWAGR
jgi:hypothetical protein